MIELNKERLAILAGELSTEGFELANSGSFSEAAKKRFLSGVIFEDALEMEKLGMEEYKASYALALKGKDFWRCGLVLTRLAVIARKNDQPNTAINLHTQAETMFSKMSLELD
jgi:hypothetical protein